MARRPHLCDPPPMTKANLNIDEMSRDERLTMIEDLWDSLARDPASVPVTDGQRAELDLRLDEMERGGAPTGIPWEEVLRQLRARA